MVAATAFGVSHHSHSSSDSHTPPPSGTADRKCGRGTNSTAAERKAQRKAQHPQAAVGATGQGGLGSVTTEHSGVTTAFPEILCLH